MKTKTLPNKPSELIRLAIADLKLVEKDKQYKVEMGTWHNPLYKGKCEVCLAGSVMAKTLKTPIEDYVSPPCFSAQTESKLYALDYFRCGYILIGLINMGVSYKKAEKVNVMVAYEEKEIVSYYAKPVLFKKQMLALADKLEKFKL